MPSSCFGVPPANSSAAVEGEKKNINKELWQCCAGPLVNMPAAGTHVVYFPQGHSEQVAASMKNDMDAQIPSYPNLPPKLLCLLHSVTLLADSETDEVYARMTLQPVSSFDKEALLRSDLSMKENKPQSEFFCKTLTASDTSTHGGFSVPRRAAEKIFPPLDFTMQPPAQEIVARDLHNNVWTFRHIYRGQPKRHLLTTGWSLFVSGKRLIAGDSVLFIRDEKQQLLLGIRRANRQPPNLSSSVLSSDSMHIGVLAAAAHAAANNSPFTVFYNPRTSPSEFVIPLAKYYRAVCSSQISLGMRFRMMFETEESGTRRYMGTITGISDFDPVRWKNSQWRNLQVGWDESTTGEKRSRVSIWEIEPVTTPFFICPTPPFFRSKRPWQPGMPEDESSDMNSLFRRTMPWLGDEFGLKDPQLLPGLSLAQWMNMQKNPSLAKAMQPNYVNPLPGSILQNPPGADVPQQLGFSTAQVSQFGVQESSETDQQLDHLQKLPTNSVSPIVQPQQQLANIAGQALPTSQGPPQAMQLKSPIHAQNIQQQQQSVENHQLQRNTSQNLPQQQQQRQIMGEIQHQNLMLSQPTDQVGQQLHMSDDQVQLQLLHKLHQRQQSLLAQLPRIQQSSQSMQIDDQQKQPIDVPSNLSRTVGNGRVLDDSQQTSTVHPQSHITGRQMAANSRQNNLRFGHSPLQSKLQQSGLLSELPALSGSALTPIANQPSAGSGNILTGAGGGRQSTVTDDVPSCSTSPSTNHCPNSVQSIMAGRNQNASAIVDEIAQSSIYQLNSTSIELPSSNGNLLKDMPQNSAVKPSVMVSKTLNQGFFAPPTYLSPVVVHADNLDSSSSATSVPSHNDGQILQNNSLSFNCQSMLSREERQDVDRGDSRKNAQYGANVDNQLGMQMMPDPLIAKDMVESGKDLSSVNLMFGSGMVSSYENAKEAQPQLSSAMVSQSFGVPDMAFDSIDSTINDGSFMNSGAWAPPQIPRMRTYTKVYKRGAVGRSLDMTCYNGYDDLKQDLARRFGIEGQLEDRQRNGWKLVYVDHENDVLLVGDDPWEEFVNCVRCIKILSAQEVQQISLDGDFGNGIIPNQACSSSDNGMN